MPTVKAGSTVKIRKAGALRGNLRATATHTLRRDVVVTKVRQWGTFGGVAALIGYADGWEIEFNETDTAEYVKRVGPKPDCSKCGGRGNLPQYAHVQGGKCFSCRPILT